jgi:hypothetical protein
MEGAAFLKARRKGTLRQVGLRLSMTSGGQTRVWVGIRVTWRDENVGTRDGGDRRSGGVMDAEGLLGTVSTRSGASASRTQ